MFSVRPTTGADKDAAIITDGWKALGAQIGIYFIPASLADDREHLSATPLALLSSNPSVDFYNVALIHSAAMSTLGATAGTARTTRATATPASTI